MLAGEESRNQRLQFLRTLYNHSQIHRQSAYPDPELATWQIFYELEGPVNKNYFDIFVTNGKGKQYYVQCNLGNIKTYATRIAFVVPVESIVTVIRRGSMEVVHSPLNIHIH